MTDEVALGRGREALEIDPQRDDRVLAFEPHFRCLGRVGRRREKGVDPRA